MNLARPVQLAVLLALASAALRCEGAGISLYASGQPVREVLQKLSDSAGQAIVLDPGVRGNLDLALTDVPFTSALSAICRSLDADWKKEQMEDDEGGKMDVYHIRPRSSPVASATATAASAPAEKPSAPSTKPSTRSAPNETPSRKDEETISTTITQAELRALVDSLPDIDILMTPRTQPRSGRLPVYRNLSPGPVVISRRPYLVLGPYGPYFVYPRRGGVEYSYPATYIPRRYLPAGW